jgi:hypothetical protein
MHIQRLSVLIGCFLVFGITPIMAQSSPQIQSSDQSVVELKPDEDHLWEHKLGPATAVHVNAVEALTLDFESYLTFEIAVSAEGRVESATLIGDEKRHLEEARGIEMARRFKPWLRDGKNIRVRVTDYVYLLPPERWALIPNSFPEPWDLKDVKIQLSRTVCGGTCPAYSVTIRGDGSVHFSGQWYVLIPGEHDVHITSAAVKELVSQFEKSRFFAANDKYIATISDGSTYTLTLTVAGKTKTVKDYEGEQAGMPLCITDLENAVDAVAGTERWIKGNEQTLASLEEERWPFTSTSAQNLNLYATVIREKNQQLIEQFLSKHGPIYSADGSAPSPVCTASEMGDMSLVRRMMKVNSAPSEGSARNGGGLPKPILNRCLADAAGSGQVKLVQYWLAHGADPKAIPERRDNWASGESVLAGAIRSENPEVVQEILKHKVDLHRMIDGTEPILCYALENGQFDKGERERVEIVEMLIKAGADVNALGRIGETPIFCAISTPDAVKLLVAAGADINARDAFGDTALIRNSYSEPFIQEMLKYGADPAAVDNNGDTPLKRTDFCKPCAAMIEAALKNRTGAGASTH